jgi:hypothetical protein
LYSSKHLLEVTADDEYIVHLQLQLSAWDYAALL